MLFADIVGWTPMSETLPTHVLIDMLNQLFSELDALTEKHGVYKVDTVGDLCKFVTWLSLNRFNFSLPNLFVNLHPE